MPKRLRPRLTFANVVSCLALFVALGSGAFAAVKLPKNSVGTKQLKKKAVGTRQLKGNAVTKNKIKKNSVVTAKIRSGAVTTSKVQNNAINGAKIADGSVTGAEIDAPSTPFARIVHKATGNSTQSIFGVAPTVYPLGDTTYTQRAGELNQFAAALNVRFDASCAPPRSAEAYCWSTPPTRKPSRSKISLRSGQSTTPARAPSRRR